MTSQVELAFHSKEPGRGAYLSRLFAFFSEEVVRHWASCDEAHYRDLGRPSLWDDSGKRHDLDFTLERRADSRRYVAELKCEIEWGNYAYLELTTPSQIEHHETNAAFAKFLRMAKDPRAMRVTLSGRGDQSVDGAILIWAVVSAEGRRAAMERYGFADVLGLEAMIADLATWQPKAWATWVGTRRTWTNDLFRFLAYPPAT